MKEINDTIIRQIFIKNWLGAKKRVPISLDTKLTMR
jgi:hypothetical protein